MPDQWRVFNNITSDLQEIMIEISIGLVLSLTLFYLAKLLNRLFNRKLLMAEPNFEFSSFNFLPPYYSECIKFNSTSKEIIFNLISADYGSQKKRVETDPGFLEMGMIQYYKYLKFYEIIFQENSGLRLSIVLKKGSMKNGLVDYDYMKYKLFKDKEESIHKIFISSIKDDIDITKYEDFKIEEYNNEKFYMSYGIQQIKIILNSKKNYLD